MRDESPARLSGQPPGLHRSAQPLAAERPLRRRAA